MERLVEEQGWQDQSAVAVLMGEWDQIVGRDIAEHVRPVSFADGELSLEADSTAWATQLRLLLPAGAPGGGRAGRNGGRHGHPRQGAAGAHLGLRSPPGEGSRTT